jgi:hypothetical protein
MAVVLHALTTQEELEQAKGSAREAFLPAANAPIWRLFHFATPAEAVNFANIPLSK